MEKTPNRKSKYFKNNNHEENTDNKLNSSTSKLFEIESPVYLSCTQEGFENIDVVWDWNSPQSKKIPKKSQKRLALAPSPIKTLKRHVSNNSIQGFEKIQEELRLLKEEIAAIEHEETLELSPIEEAKYKDDSNSVNNIELESFMNENEDIFDDSFDEQLLDYHTSQIENQLNEVNQRLSSHCNNGVNINKDLNRVEALNNIPPHKNEIKHHSDVFQVIDTTNLNESLQVFNNRYNLKSESSLATVGKVEFHRTQSFEMSNLEHLSDLPVNQKEEIERKRKEALAKLELKKMNASSISPSQCSSEEIELKRQEALAKREARRQQEIIERNRQNALKRLEMTRKKNAQAVKSTLTSRLN